MPASERSAREPDAVDAGELTRGHPARFAAYNDDDLIGTDATTAQSNFDRSHVLYQAIARLADVTREHRALRDGAHQHRFAADGPGIYAFSRLARAEQHEYVVALNNAETELSNMSWRASWSPPSPVKPCSSP